MKREHEESHGRFQEALGRTIKVMRAERQLTQQQLAEAAGISRSYLNQLEKGSRSKSRGGASTDIIGRLAEALGVSPSQFMAEVQARQERPPLSPGALSPGPEPLDPKSPWLQAEPSRRRAYAAIRAEENPPSLPEPLLGSPDVSVGHARIQALREFEMLLPYLSAEDLEIVLGMMRRLAGQR